MSNAERNEEFVSYEVHARCVRELEKLKREKVGFLDNMSELEQSRNDALVTVEKLNSRS